MAGCLKDHYEIITI